MKTTELFQKLHYQGVRKLEMNWSCGGDDGYIEDVKFFPHDRHPLIEEIDALKEVAWGVYEQYHGGYTAGEFHAEGELEVLINKDGTYQAKSENRYSDDEYDEETDEYVDGDPDVTSVEKVTLREN